MPGDQEDDRAGSKNIVPGDQNRKINNRAGIFIWNIRVLAQFLSLPTELEK